jgi:hypothetical protein
MAHALSSTYAIEQRLTPHCQIDVTPQLYLFAK